MADRRAGRQSRAAVVGLALLAIVPMLAKPCGGSSLEGVAGWEGDRDAQGYGFLTMGTAPAQGARWSVPVRVTGSYLYYEYETGGNEIGVRAPGVGGLLGLRLSGARGSLAVLVGGEGRWERRWSSGSAASAAVARGGVVAQGEATFAIGKRLRPFLLANYSGSARYIYSRAELPLQLTNLDWSGPVALFAGLEGAVQGNADTDATQIGGSVGCSFTKSRISLGVHGGSKESRSAEGTRKTGTYFGVSLYRRF